MGTEPEEWSRYLRIIISTVSVKVFKGVISLGFGGGGWGEGPEGVSEFWFPAGLVIQLPGIL